MRFRKILAVLAATGIAVIAVGLYITTLDFGSCPSITVGSSVHCYHTFPNTSIYIYPTGITVVYSGIVIIIATLAVGLYYRFGYKRSHQPK